MLELMSTQQYRFKIAQIGHISTGHLLQLALHVHHHDLLGHHPKCAREGIGVCISYPIYAQP